MLSSFAFSFEMDDRGDDLDARDWRAIALGALGRSGDALLVCDSTLDILFASPRALNLLRRLGDPSMKILPDSLAAIVRAQLASDIADPSDRLVLPAGNALEVQASTLRFSGRANISIYLREEILRDDDLFAVLRDRYSITMRGFQLALLLKKGLTNRQIGERLTLAESTVKIYLHQLYKSCGVSSRTSLIALLDRLP
jgi:DNA-binding CsgD family transcriptional regulator